MRKKKVAIVGVLFGIFFLGVYLQHQFVWLYFDDYGYASLCYGNEQNYMGMQYSLGDVLRYLRWHYLEWGGRILYFFFGILSMKAGLWCIRLVQSALILGLSVFSYRLIRDEGDSVGNTVKALGIIFSYGALTIETVYEGTYWFTASVLYVWPLCPLFAAAYCQRRLRESGDRRYLPAVCGLFFLAAFSYEQTALLTAVYVALYYWFMALREKGLGKESILVLGSTFLGSGLEILAPGNFARAANDMYAVFNSLSFMGKVRENLPKLLEVNLGYSNRISVLFYLTSGIFCGMLLLWKRGGIACRCNLAAGIVLAALALSAWGMVDRRYFCGVLVLWILWYCVNMTAFLWERKGWLLFLFYAGLCSQGMMLLTPAVLPRCHIPMEFIMHIVTAYTATEFLRACKGRAATVLAAGLMAGLAVLALHNSAVIAIGYYRNSDINRMNDKSLTRATETKDGEVPETVVLYRLRDDRYASQMPYEHQYIEYWMKNYYELPQETVFVWEKADEATIFFCVD